MREETVNDPVEKQMRIEKRLEELIIVQKRIMENVANIIDRVDSIRAKIKELTDTLEFSLESLSRELLPSRLREMGVDVEALESRCFIVDGEETEVTLCGEGVLSGRKVLILGEVKSRIYCNDVERFNLQAEKIGRHLGREIFKLMFDFAVHPSAMMEAERRNISLFTVYKTSGA